ncbi:MAG: acetyl-CoA carboxylase biotin carboxyl carrier protein [Thermodesulfobacteriota bacterium]
MMNIKELKILYKFLKNTDIMELESEDGESRIKIKRRFPSEPKARGGNAANLELIPAPRPAPAAPTISTDTSESSEASPAENIKTVTSPMVGTFYGAPAPDSDAYVEVGSRVSTGQTLCIIEAMKLMNEVECEFSGVITSILVENGQPVEYGEPLFYVDVS